jgi:hypothetical protein
MSSLPPCGPAPFAASYKDLSTGFAALQAHAKANGYALFKRDGKRTRVVYACDRAGKYDSKGKQLNTHSTKRRTQTASKKCDCKMQVALRFDNNCQLWHVESLESIRNHPSSQAPTAHPAHRIASIKLDTHARIQALTRAGLAVAQILTTLRQENPELLLAQKDISNIVQHTRISELGGQTPIAWLMHVSYTKAFIQRSFI